MRTYSGSDNLGCHSPALAGGKAASLSLLTPDLRAPHGFLADCDGIRSVDARHHAEGRANRQITPPHILGAPPSPETHLD